MPHRFRSLALLMLLLAAGRVSAGPLEDAAAHLAAGRFAEVESSLKTLLEAREVPVQALVLSYQAAIRDGRVYTAERRVAELIKREGSRDPEWIYRGAQVSQALGDRTAYLDRLRFYSLQKTGKSPELQQALLDLSRLGLRTDAYARLVKDYGKDVADFELGMDMLRRLRNSGQPAVYLEQAGTLLATWPDAERVRMVQRELNDALRNRVFGLERKDVVEVVLNHAVFDVDLVYEIMDRTEDSASWFRLQDAVGKPLPPDLLGRLRHLDGLDSATLRESFAKRFLRLEPMYRTQGIRDHYFMFVERVLQQPKSFLGEENRVVSDEQAVAMFTHLATLYQARPWVLRDMGRRLMTSRHDGTPFRFIESEQARNALLLKFPQSFREDELRLLVAGRTRDVPHLREVLRLTGNNLDLRMSLLEDFNNTQQKDLVMDTARDALVFQPHRFHEERLARYFLSSTLLTEAEKIAVLRQAYERTGYNERLRNLLNHRDNRHRRDPAFVQFVEGMDKNRKSPDPVLAGLLRGLQLGRKGRDPDPELHTVVAATLKAFGTRFPDAAKGPHNEYVSDLLDHYFNQCRDSNQGKVRYMEVVTPWVNDGISWRTMIQDGIWGTNRDGDAAYAIAKAHIGLKLGYDPAFRFVREPKGSTQALLAPFYKEMDYADGVQYLLSNLSSWGDTVFLQQVDAFLAAQPPNLEHDVTRRLLAKMLEQVRENPKVPVPFDRLAGRFFVSANLPADLRSRVLALYKVAGRYDEGAAKWLSALQSAGPEAVINGILDASTFGTGAQWDYAMATEGLGEQPNPLALKGLVAGPLRKALAAKGVDPRRITVHGRIFDHIQYRVDRGGSKEPGIADVTAGEAELLLLLGNGAAMAGDPNMQNALRRALPDAIAKPEKDQLLALLRATADPGASRMRGNDADDMVKALSEAGLYEPLFLLTNTVRPPDSGAAAVLSRARAMASSRVPGIYPVDRTHPAYPLYKAADELSLNNEEGAWTLLREHLAVFEKDPTVYPGPFIAWAVEKLRMVKGEGNAYLEKARVLCDLVLAKERDLDADLVANVSLTRAEIFRDLKNFEAAALEYKTIRNNPRFQNTRAGRKAMFRDVDLMIAMGNPDAAEGLLEYWLSNPDAELQAQAHYFRALIAFHANDMDGTRENLEKVFQINFTHTEGRFLHGEWKLREGREVDETQVWIGTLADRNIIRPGQQFPITVQDKNLAVVGGGSSIPILIKTSNGGDYEVVNLYPGTRNPYLFQGTIDTKLAAVVVSNRVLELNGQDMVTYELLPDFVESRGLKASPPKTLQVVDDARLAVSAGRILTEKEQQEQEVIEQMSAATGRRPTGTTQNNVRPGNPIYAMVRDRDRSISDALDTIHVSVSTRSGDRITAFPLTETEPHSGVFRGEIPTALPPPRATASDTAEGLNPGDVINNRRNGLWVSRADGKQGKWLEADTMNSHMVKQAVLQTPNADEIAQVTLWGRLAETELVRLGAFPERVDSQKGGVALQVLNDTRASSLLQYRQAFADSQIASRSSPGFSYDHPSDNTGRAFHLKGAMYLPEARSVSLTFLPKHANDSRRMEDAYLFLVVDGDVVASGRGSDLRKRAYPVSLAAGGHHVEVFGRANHRRDSFALAVEQDDGNVVAVPDEWFSVTAHPELAEFLKDKARIRKTPDGFVAEFPQPHRLRQVRWEFNQFAGKQVSVSSLGLVDDAGTTILPSATDFTDGLNNQVVECAPGDMISVSYVDEVTANGQKRTLRSDLYSSFSNGTIGFFFEVLTAAKGSMVSNLHTAYRYQPGDPFMIVVSDPDADLGPQADTVDITVTTRGGEQLVLKAVETGNAAAQDKGVHGGSFRAILRTTLTGQTGGDTIRVLPGDKLTATYLDRENTQPGIPFRREAELLAVQPSTPELTLFHLWREREEDTSEAATEKLEQIRRRSGNDHITALYTHTTYAMPMTPEEIAAERLRVNGDTPVPVEVYYPSKALHSGSALKLRAVAKSEQARAEAEGREPARVELRMGLGRGGSNAILRPNPRIPKDSIALAAAADRAIGTFGSALWLKLGGAGDDVALQGAASAPDLLGTRGSAEPSGPPAAATLLVQGSDEVLLQVLDESDAVLFEKTLQLVSEGSIALKDSTFEAGRDRIHLGERFYVEVVDTDRDLGATQDVVRVTVESVLAKQSVDLDLWETLPNSGVFTAVLLPEFMATGAQVLVPTAATNEPATVVSSGLPRIGVAFGDTLRFSYHDALTLPIREPQTFSVEGRIFDGSDGKVAAFTKRFTDADMAVSVQFRLAQCLFEMAKDFRALKQRERSSEVIAEGKLILEEALRNYPDTSLVVEGEYLLANLYQELAAEEEAARLAGVKEQSLTDEEAKRMQDESIRLYQEALARYSALLSTWPESEYAARAQYHKALCLEKLGDFARAGEEYVKMTYVFPESPLVGDAAIRLAQHYYQFEKRYDVAGKIYANFYRRFSAHPLAPKALFMAAQCHMKQAEIWENERREKGMRPEDIKTARILDEYLTAVKNLYILIEEQKDTVDKDVRAQAMYWAGDASLRGMDFPNAYIYLKRTVFEYPETEWARRARGLLMQEAESFRGLE